MRVLTAQSSQLLLVGKGGGHLRVGARLRVLACLPTVEQRTPGPSSGLGASAATASAGAGCGERGDRREDGERRVVRGC